MSETTSITVLPDEVVQERVRANLMVPMDDGRGLQAVYCGDVRKQTAASLVLQGMVFEQPVIPGRIFGGGLGVVEATLVTIAAQDGPNGLEKLRNEFGPNFRGEMLALMAARAFQRDNILLTVHSAVANEGHNHQIVSPRQAKLLDLGCTFATLLGPINEKAARPSTRFSAKLLLSELGMSLPLDEAENGLMIIQKEFEIPSKFGRQDLHQVMHGTKFVPVTILQNLQGNDQAGLVMDLKGYRSDSAAHIDRGLPRYHTTPELGKLGARYWDRNLDEGILIAAAFKHGMATAEQLQSPGKQLPIEIITS